MGILRGLRRRLQAMPTAPTGVPVGQLTLRVLAVSPFEEEPDVRDGYQPSLIVESDQVPGAAGFAPDTLAIATLLLLEWATQRQKLAPVFVPRLAQLLPRLQLAVRGGHLGPARYAAHRAGQQERYFHHREAATYEVTLLRDDQSMAVTVREQVSRGPWEGDATLLTAVTMAPYELLLHLEREAGLAWLTTLAAAVARWEQGERADFPLATWAAQAAALPALDQQGDLS